MKKDRVDKKVRCKLTCDVLRKLLSTFSDCKWPRSEDEECGDNERNQKDKPYIEEVSMLALAIVLLDQL